MAPYFDGSMSKGERRGDSGARDRVLQGDWGELDAISISFSSPTPSV
jgi:hypothetical protein